MSIYPNPFQGVLAGPLATRIETCAELPTFGQFVDMCLFDQKIGYYSTGRVEFGHKKDFWTYPREMSPLFGQMVASAFVQVEASLRRDGILKPKEPFRWLELGGGQGHCTRDVLQYLPRYRQQAGFSKDKEPFEAIMGDRSETLRKVQAEINKTHIQDGSLKILEVDAFNLEKLPRPFKGIVFSNELFDAMAPELVSVSKDDLYISKLLISLPLASESGTPGSAFWQKRQDSEKISVLPDFPDRRILTLEMLRDYLEEAYCHPEAIRYEYLKELRFYEVLGTPSSDLLEELRPLRDRTRSYLSADKVCKFPYVPGVRNFFKTLHKISQDSLMVLFTVDYGGTDRMLFHPGDQNSLVRTYGVDREIFNASAELKDNPYLLPGLLDITTDVNFTELAEWGKFFGFSCFWYGHQRALEPSDNFLWEGAAQDFLIAKELERSGDMFQATLDAHTLVQKFRYAPGFRLMIQASGTDTLWTPDVSPLPLKNNQIPFFVRNGFLEPLPDWSDRDLEHLGRATPGMDGIAFLEDNELFVNLDKKLQELEGVGMVEVKNKIF